MLDSLLIHQQLDTLAHQAIHGGQLVFSFDKGNGQCDLESVDRIGCAVRNIVLCYQPIDATTVSKLANQLSQKLHYLVEPLRVIEVDIAATTAQLRSDPPSRSSSGTRTYYELLVGRDRMELVRYEAAAGQTRARITMHLTREILVRLLEDLVHYVENS